MVVFELEVYPEPKALSYKEVIALWNRFKSTIKVAEYIGASQAFVWAKIKIKSE